MKISHLDRSDASRRIGKIGELLVVSSLLAQGYDAVLANEGTPFDILIATNGNYGRCQVKTTYKRILVKGEPVYRFYLRKRKCKNIARYCKGDRIHYFAFVALEVNRIGFVKASDLLVNNDELVYSVIFKCRNFHYCKNIKTFGYIEEFKKFRV